MGAVNSVLGQPKSIAEKIEALSWTCPRCTCPVPPLVEQVLGATLVRRQACRRCGQEHDQSRLLVQHREEEVKRREVELREERRKQSYFKGLSANDAPWLMRFETFRRDREPHAYDSILGWVGLLCSERSEAIRLARQKAQGNGEFDEACYTSRFQDFWAVALRKTRNLILTGRVGTGKSHLMLAIYHALIDADVPVFYVPALAFLDALRESWNREAGESEGAMMSKLYRVVLLLDGVGYGHEPVKGGGWAQGRWASLMEGRAKYRYPCVVSGLSEEAVSESLGPLAFDKLLDGASPVQLEQLESFRTCRVRPAEDLRELGTRLYQRISAPSDSGSADSGAPDE